MSTSTGVLPVHLPAWTFVPASSLPGLVEGDEIRVTLVVGVQQSTLTQLTNKGGGRHPCRRGQVLYAEWSERI